MNGWVGASGGGGAASQLPYQPCALDQRVGQFSVALTDRYTSVSGQVFDGLAPIDVPIEAAAEGGCRLLQTPVVQCDPACQASTQACGAGNQCVPRPVAHDVGTVTLQGLAVPLELAASAATKSYSNPPSPKLPQPGFAPGADVRLTSSGGDYAPMALRGWGVSLLTGVDDPVPVRTGMPVQVHWQAPADTAGPARVHLTLDINHHGSTKAWIECEVDDQGSAEISETLVDQLLLRGQSGFPTLTVTRRSATSTSIEPGCVEFSVLSEVTSDVALEQLTSCSSSADCAPGQTCRSSELYCE
ncbi:MAG TPA: hypothetical protein VG963_29305 [Polyangiaceae bacterium]|nr:hypothetical protein [Polyangiaceae bacterium]